MRLKDVLENQAIDNEEKMLLPVAKYLLSEPTHLEVVSLDLTQRVENVGLSDIDGNLHSNVADIFGMEALRLLGAVMNEDTEFSGYSVSSLSDQKSMSDRILDQIEDIICLTGEKVRKAFPEAKEEGDDVYDAGNFSQGTGYYFGVGVLDDASGNDRYLGSRYCFSKSSVRNCDGTVKKKNFTPLY